MPASVYVPSPAEAVKVSTHVKLAASTTTTQTADKDASMVTVDDLVRLRAKQRPDAHAISYPSSGINFVSYTMQQLDVFAWRVAKHYEAAGLPARASSAEKPAVVAMLGPSNLEYLATMLALSKLGHTALLLSTRIPQPAIENLLTVTGATTLIADARYVPIAEDVQKAMPETALLRIAARSDFEFPIDVVGDTCMTGHLDPEVEKNHLAFIIHSSGSTGLPKPICQTQKSCLANYVMSMNMKAFITLPLYHNHGICNLFRAVFCGKPLYMYNADLPLTREYLVKVMRENQFEIFYGVPYALKLLAESDDGIRLLQELKIVMYGGSACPDDLGNMLVESGVNLVGHYGATEVGQLMTSFRPEGDKAWNYVRERDALSPFLKWIPRGPNLYECCVIDGWPAKVQSNQPDGSYHTKDLFEPHPTIPRAWKYIARLDDTIALLNGEKFGPVSMEGAIRSSKSIAEAVVFGSGRPNLGLLVIPAAHLADKTQEEILDVVWPVVDAANQNVDAFGRISRSMIKLLPTDVVYPRTDKGSIIRQAFYRTFKEEIEETYDAQDVANLDNVTKFETLEELKAFLTGLLASTLKTPAKVEDDTDFFLLGLDSLQAIQMRSEILRAVDIGGQKLGQNVVFEQPSVDKLGGYLYALSRGEDASEALSIEAQMEALIEKYGNVKTSPSQSAVALTGATGSLGAHVVAKLAVNPSISTIFCLVRANDKKQALNRVKESMLQRRVYHSLPLASRRKIVALPSDLADARLGLSDKDYAAVAANLASVIHCAWSVNFNMQLSSFEKGNIAGVNHLLALCKSSSDSSREPASFNFCSSVSTVTRCTVVPIPESLPELAWAQGMGYAQSKSVAEHMCSRAAQDGIKARVLRVGQIVGDTANGVWNAQEAVPMMMQTAVTIGALPKLTETPSWLPVDIVAEAVADIALSDTDAGFTHVMHPKTFNFVDRLLPALRAAGLTFDEVEPKEWIRRLRESNPDPKVNPPIKLVDFFASKYDKDEFSPSKPFATDVACSLSPALANAPLLDEAFVKQFIGYFQANAWNTSKESSSRKKRAVFMAGPAGTGKSTAGTHIANWLCVPFIEGDSLHARAAVEKMKSGTALSDDDRASWLKRICSRAREAVDDNGLAYDSVVVSCSALKQAYREHIRTELASNGVEVVFVDLQASKDVLLQRLSERKGHYMSAAMVDSQLGAYEGATAAESDVLPVDAEQEEGVIVEEVKWLLTSSAGLAGP